MTSKVFVLFLLVLLFLPFSEIIAAKSSVSTEDTTVVVSKEPSADSIQMAMKEFNSLKNSEKRSRFKEMKKAIKAYKADKKAGNDVSTNTLLLVILSILIPPLAVYLHEGETNSKFWISVLLTILGYVLFGFAGIFFLGSLPGIIYALIVVLST